MTAPKDPNQPGWAAPPEANQPAQPGWGQPPAQPGWGQPGWNAAPPAKKGHGCLIAFLIVLGLLIVGVGACTWFVYPYVSTEIKLLNDLGTERVSSVEFNIENGRTTWIIRVNPGYEDEATYMACHIIRPDLQGTQFANDSFVVVNRYGRVLASDQTPCT